ncbi:MAG: aminopeptidase, partial [Candidatus Cloacimonadaceae bacterium]|nr:aminopeptidase [Candidatus Cloacimonadaceae bacterium]
FGNTLAPRDIQMAQFISQYPEAELQSLAEYIVQAYLDGFERAGKDYKIKKYAALMFPLGMERFARLIAMQLKSIGLEARIGNPMSIGANRQYQYDTRFLQALYLSEENADLTTQANIASMEAMKDAIRANSGAVYVEVFGEEPFEPLAKETALKYSEEQLNLQRRMQGKFSQFYNENFPATERSFCIIAFPSPEIGKDFKEIFAETIRLNRLDSNHYATIQQHIIDVLDKAEYVHVRGVPGNETDIKVFMHKINDPEKETNFENCVADVNIPVGEVFTSPMLTGTNGILHVDDIYLNNLRFLNLKMEFTDGMVSGYSCTNFHEEEKNKSYIEENLLHPHKTLPIGEFAIGTNTLAYAMAKKYDIMRLLPILIIEKMGPHFAIGDTCYSHEEEFPHHNIASKKLIIAVDNEKSAIRHENPMEAYTQKHTDITLPYEMLNEISAVNEDGTRIPIIKNGRFAVPGTEELNLPLVCK